MAADTRDPPDASLPSSDVAEKPRLYRSSAYKSRATGTVSNEEASPSPTVDESDRPVRKAQPKHPNFPKSQVGKLWDELGNPSEPANSLPGGTFNSAGGKPKEVTVWGTIAAIPQDMSNIKMEEFQNLHRLPCAREGLLYGIGAGFGVGGVRAIMGGTVWTACNYAVGSFTLMAVGAFAYCQKGWAKERKQMNQVVQLMQQRKMEKARQDKEQAAKKEQEQQRQRLEAERLRQSWTRWQNYKFW